MITVIYAIWFIIPAFFFAMALWAKLEQLSKSPKKHDPSDFMKQGFFVLICALIAWVVDQYVLQPNAANLFPDLIPLALLQVLLLPAILSVAAMLTGGMKPIRATFGTKHFKQKGRH